MAEMAQKIFDDIDADNNGQVDAAELSGFLGEDFALVSQILTNFGQTTSFTLHGLATRVVELIYDVMGWLFGAADGLTMDEIDTVIDTLGDALTAFGSKDYLKSAIGAAFGNVDINKDGNLTKAELQAAVD